MITQAQCREMFEYDKETGHLTWKENRNAKARKGAVVGCVGSSGHIQTLIQRKNYAVHRLIWMYMYGESPEEIDHINRDKTDNRIDNLRACTKRENAKNKGMFSNNKSGFKGVSWSSKYGKYQVTCKVDGVKKWLGYFDDPRKASEAYRNYATISHGEFYGDD